MSTGNPNFGVPNSNEDLNTILNWEAFWAENGSTIEASMRTIMNNIFEKSSGFYSAEEQEKRIFERIEVEKNFSKVLLEALRVTLEKSKKVLALFDVDETIGKAVFSEGNTMHTIIRPSFLAVMERVAPLRVKGVLDVGLLTTRGIPKEQLEDANHLGSIKKYIHSDHIYSTRTVPERHMNTSDEEKEMKDDTEAPIRQGLTENDFIGASGAMKKLTLLKDLRKQHPDVAFVVADDDRYPQFLDEARGFKGVQLDRDTMFSLS